MGTKKTRDKWRNKQNAKHNKKEHQEYKIKGCRSSYERQVYSFAKNPMNEICLFIRA